MGFGVQGQEFSWRILPLNLVFRFLPGRLQVVVQVPAVARWALRGSDFARWPRAVWQTWFATTLMEVEVGRFGSLAVYPHYLQGLLINPQVVVIFLDFWTINSRMSRWKLGSKVRISAMGVHVSLIF